MKYHLGTTSPRIIFRSLQATLLPIALISTLITNSHADDQTSTGAPRFLAANSMSIATGKPSLVMMSSGSTHIPVWSLSGGTIGQSVAGVVAGFSKEYAAVKIEITVTSNDPTTSPEFEDVYRVHLSQMIEGAPFTSRYHLGKTVRSALPAGPFYSRNIVLESWYEVEPEAPLWIRIQREPGDEGDTFTRPTGLAMVKVTPLKALAEPRIVQDVPGYNSWPMIQALDDKLVCTYSRGSAHTIHEDARGVYARTSTDGGKTWTPETIVAETPGYGEVTVGKGLDSAGAMLLWVRRIGKDWNHDLYRTTDGVNFTRIATPELAIQPMQITDVFSVPEVGLMALWFAGDYSDKPNQSWGTLTSKDDGLTWTQNPVETGLTKPNWPTEPSAVYLGNGRILAIGRTETGPAQFQLTSTDYGKTWTKTQTNISDISASTPSLILDKKTGLLSNYYYERGRGILRCRVVDPESVFEHPLHWPDSEAITIASPVAWDSGNANATALENKHYISFYSGKAPDTSVLVTEFPITGEESVKPDELENK